MPMRSRLSTTTEPALEGAELEDGARMPPLHPGEMLREDFMKPLGLSANALAMELRVPVTRISEIVRERRGITADTALRLARYFSMSPEFWMRLQMDFDLESAVDAEETAIREAIRPRPVKHLQENAEFTGHRLSRLPALAVSTMEDRPASPRVAREE